MSLGGVQSTCTQHHQELIPITLDINLLQIVDSQGSAWPMHTVHGPQQQHGGGLSACRLP